MRLPVRSLARFGRRLRRGRRVLVAVLASAVAAGRRVGRGPRVLVAVLASAPAAAGRLGRMPRTIIAVVALASAALGMGAGASHREQERKSELVPATQAATSPVVSAAAVSELVTKRTPRRGGVEHYRRTARRHVPPKAVEGFLPLYREAERVYGVNWLLIASIHRQETAFSKAPTTYHGLNDFGCCAGPMQFNVTNGPPSTWSLYRNAYRKGRRPADYPHRTREHPSIYDDFDAIMAAGSLLSDSGAGPLLDVGAWLAAYAYYGHDLFGITYANQVLARAAGWERDGFCPNCEVDDGLVAEFDGAYGESARQQLLADESRRKKHKRARRGRDKRAKDERAAEQRRRRARARARRRARRPAVNERPGPARPRPRRRKAPTAAPVQPPPTSAQPSPPPPTPPPSPADECHLIRKLLGCR